MKTLFCLIAFFSLSLQVQAQTYFILHVTGDIKVKETATPIKSGDKISAETELLFGDQSAKAIAMSKEEGRILLDGSKTQPTLSGEFVSLLKRIVVPMKRSRNLSTRGDDDHNFQNFFGNEKFAIIGNELRFKLDNAIYPNKPEWIFAYWYLPEGSSSVSKKIPRNENELIFNKSLYIHKGNTYSPEQTGKAQIFYYNTKTRQKQKVAEFYPTFVDENQLKEELNNLASFMVDNELVDQQQLEEELIAYVQDVYGKISKDQFSSWISDNPISK
ncbi:hypothetical protein [Sediminitomix flava]|uniref:GLPGLI family protein n=1 Tax=Sediminitomix flava TaxID=379075 RepID=A0A315ZAC6_SEDFL|nr:hypothetical protein [Sediminitomix flava]PWJ42491.1 hypothetical protein BC781_10232 [Sediminitomix flava]